ncbi:carboxypeptidase regulatory-like domain-containing protein [Actinacidiphila yeochonensis]|uniref:carboxypeptidase regulatory-like domain-containing protein n=1 Tax=Actinacidiphila yeochonensis TaxID=89050 RepID=UPI00068FB5BC|nr:carboxypeptidase regulatory-like domain-containing protein [Actinacidiphila yeochonensis]
MTEPSHAAPRIRPGRTLAETLWFPAALFLGFLFCFAPALHSPAPHHARVAVAGSASQVASDLRRQYPGGFEVSSVSDAAAARQAVLDRDAAAGLVTGDSPVLYVATADGASLSQKMGAIMTAVAAGHGQKLTVRDVVPTTAGDPLGTSAVYLAIAWSVPGYLLATALLRAVAFDRRRRFLVVLGVAALFSAAGSAVSAGLGYLPVTPSTMGIAFLLTTAVATAASGLAPFTRQFFPAVGMGMFIVLSIPTSGGPAPAPLLPPVFRFLHSVMPLGNAVDALRGTVYFDGAGTLKPVLVLLGWIAAGAGLMALDALLHHRRDARDAARRDLAAREGVPDVPDVAEIAQSAGFAQSAESAGFAEPAEPPADDPALDYPAPTALPAHRHHFGEREPDLVGTVHGAGLGPVRHAAVTVVDGHGRRLVRTTTDEDGGYALAGLPEGHLIIIASAAGRTPAVQRRHLRPGAVVQADFALDGATGVAGATGATGATVS